MTRERAYSYDELERLTEVAVAPTPGGSPTQAETYTLDEEGNRTSSHLSDMHQTDEANLLTSDDSYTYVYDLNGNLTGKLAKEGACYLIRFAASYLGIVPLSVDLLDDDGSLPE